MDTGTLFDTKGDPILNDCTVDQAVTWLRNHPCQHRTGSHYIWVPDNNCVVIYDAHSNFKHVPRKHATLPTDPDTSPHFPE